MSETNPPAAAPAAEPQPPGAYHAKLNIAGKVTAIHDVQGGAMVHISLQSGPGLATVRQDVPFFFKSDAVKDLKPGDTFTGELLFSR